jgi:glycosyltransferase involved in cell wall biosynthesis
MAVLKNERETAVLEIAGTGDDLPRLRKKAEIACVNDRIVFRGALTDSELESAFRSCDLFALPSSGEGFGIAFLEAMSYAKPCLGADCGGIPEVITPGVDGYLVPYGSVSEIAERIRLFSRDRKLTASLGANGYEKVAQNYLMGNMLANWRNLLASTSPADPDSSRLIEPACVA